MLIDLLQGFLSTEKLWLHVVAITHTPQAVPHTIIKCYNLRTSYVQQSIKLGVVRTHTRTYVRTHTHTYSTRKYKVSESNSSYSVLLQYKFTLLYCVLLRGRSNGPHKEDWPDKRKRS